MFRECALSLEDSAFDKLCYCEFCKNSKSRLPPVIQKLEKRKSSKLDLVFTDNLGPMPTTLLIGNQYAIAFTNSDSRYSEGNRSETFSAHQKTFSPRV